MLSKIKEKILNSKILLTIAKVILVVVVIALAIIIVMNIVKKYKEITNSSPWLLKGTKTAQQAMIVPQDPDDYNSILIQRSKEGLDFTYSSWIYISNLSDDNTWKHVFHKGSPQRTPLFCPGVWLSGNKNTMRVKVNTFKEMDESLDVTNLPLRKWFHVAIYVSQNSLDVWINGNMVQSKKLESPPKQNQGNFYIANNGGFNGFISNIQYFSYKLPYYKLENIIKIGPNTGSCIDSGESPPYFNNEWWLLQ